jgi:endonuclease YncB( thermonuclease family)
MRETTGGLWIGIEARSTYRRGSGKPWELPMDPHGNPVKSPLPKRGSLNQELVKQGWCWYRKYAPGNAVLEGLEAKVREGRNGLWADPQLVPPWEWRKRK